MSEYQYYEFAAVDRPLDERQLGAVRALSTRAHITPTSFVNTYEWGNFSGDPRRMVERYYDAFLYLANWGTRELILRFPARLLDLDGVQRYCGDCAVSAWGSGGYVVLAVVAEDEEADFEWGGEGVLASILPVRSEILAGDERALYLLWLLGVQTGEIRGNDVEPPVPTGLDTLTGSQAALVEFLRIDGDLVAAAAAGSIPRSRALVDVGEWVAGLVAGERDELLVALLRDDDPHLRAQTLRRFGPPVIESGARRTARQLADAATARRDERERAARVRREQATAERERRMMEARRERLAALAGQGEAAWDRVSTLIAEKKPAGYDAAVELLVDLQEITGKAEFARRVEALRAEQRR